MFRKIDIQEELSRFRRKNRRGEDDVLSEAKRILNNDLFTERKILEHLGHYTRMFDLIDEEDIDPEYVHSPAEIKRVAVENRLKFLNSNLYKGSIPPEAVMLIKGFNKKMNKDLKEFRILAPHATFLDENNFGQSSLFVKTNHDNYFLIYTWGQEPTWYRKIKYWPLRNFETLASSLILFTLIVTLPLPTHFITLDSKATYWCGYRAAAFFHLLIFHSGVTVYFAFAFALNFSSSIWNKVKDFG